MLTGVIGGFAEYVGGIDPTVLRLAFVFLTIVTGFIPGIAAYILGAVIVPEAPREQPESSDAPLTPDEVSQG
jgi:phage shock protein C